MVAIATWVAAGEGGGDLLVGLFVGMAAGLLVGPAFRSWVARREWNEASRRARLTDEVLARMDEDPHDPVGLDAGAREPRGERRFRRGAAHPWPQR